MTPDPTSWFPENESFIELSDWPRMTPCFMNTVIVWIPCWWLWLLLPFHIYFLHSRRNCTAKIPVNALSVSKLFVCLFLCLQSIVYLIEELIKPVEKENKILPIQVLNYSLYAASFLLASILSQIDRIQGLVTSATQFVFWLLLVVTNVIPLFTKILEKSYIENLLDFVTFCVFYVFLLLQFILQCWAERNDNLVLSKEEKNMCPEMNASILNRICFWWMNRIAIKAYKKPLEETDVWTIGISNKSETVAPYLEKQWRKEVAKDEVKIISSPPDMSMGTTYSLENCGCKAYKVDRGQTKPSLVLALIKTFGLDYLISLFFKILSDAIQFANPFLLSVLIQYAETKSELPTWRGYIPGILLFLCGIIQSVFEQQNFHIGMTVGMRVKTSLMATVYKKSLTLHPSARKSITLGEIVNLMSVDCQRIQEMFTYAWSVISCCVHLSIGIIVLWSILGASCFAGVFVLILLSLLSSVIAMQQKKLQMKVMQWKGERIKLMNEILNGMKILKMYAWEIYFMKKVKDIRNKELRVLKRHACWHGGISFVWLVAPFMVTLSTFTSYVVSSEEHFLDARKVFVAVLVYNMLRIPINFMALSISLIIQISVFVQCSRDLYICHLDILIINTLVFVTFYELTNQLAEDILIIAPDSLTYAFVSVRRIEQFLTKSELEPDISRQMSYSDSAVEVEDGTFSWDPSIPTSTLRDINLKLDRGQLTAIVGHVGCGKSSLISALLGEMDKLAGRVSVRGSVAYVSQEAWIQNATVRDNVLFGKDFQQKWYNDVIEACALNRDLEIFPGGDLTEIGEKGINISGGQKQRVSLARAVYSNSDIYLMDDPLSAVDSHVGKHIFEKVIGSQGLLKNKTRVLVTHGLHWLPMVDKVVVMTNGKASETGSFEEIVSHDGPLSQLLMHHSMQEENGDDEDLSEIQKIKQKMLEKVDSVAPENRYTKTSIKQKNCTFSRKLNTPEARENPTAIEMTSLKKLDGTEKLTLDELSEQEKIKFSVFGEYYKDFGVLKFVTVVLLFSAFTATYMYSNFWLTYWTEDPYLKNNKNNSASEEYINRSYRYLMVYGILGFVQAVLVFTYAIFLSVSMVVAAGKLHHKMLDRVLRAPMEMFDRTPIGRITNIFSSDIDILDNILPLTFRTAFHTLVYSISVLIVILITYWLSLMIIIPIAILFYLLMKFYLPTSWYLKRLESVKRSPVYNHFSETVTGASIIRAFSATQNFIEESLRRVDDHQSYYYTNFTLTRWLGLRIEVLGHCLVFATVLFSIFTDTTGGMIGLLVTIALQMNSILNILIVNITEFAKNFVCVERIKRYSEAKIEAAFYTDNRPPEHWPSKGIIKFIDYKTRYREGLDLVLKGINLEISHGEMIGIIGRTGAGKTSLSLSLFRLIEAASGSIIIDGVNIADIGLHDLRSNIAMLPQDPILFSGSIRMNLDPFDQYTDDMLWYALEKANLKEFVLSLPLQLDYQSGEGGSNLSFGQRQLVCLARTLLKKTKILVLDEATAAVDLKTDDYIQLTIRTEFRDCTVLTIAHRLNTIIDYDKVVILEEGEIIETGCPAELLKQRNSIFFGMAQAAGLS